MPPPSQRTTTLLIPSTNVTVERDLDWLQSQGALGSENYRVSKLPLFPGDQDPARLVEMNEHILDACESSAEGGSSVICYFCTTGSFFQGRTYETDLLDRMRSVGRATAIATASATRAALEAVGARRIVVVSPYIDWINTRLVEYYRACGFEVLDLKRDMTAAESGFSGINDQSPESIVDVVTSHELPNNAAVLLPCTAWRALEVAQVLEDRLDRPVITANQATYWAALRATGSTQTLEMFGRLGAR